MYTCQTATLLETSCHSSIINIQYLLLENLSSWFLTCYGFNQPAQLQGLARILIFCIWQVQICYISRKQITKVLIRLCRCPGFSAPLFVCIQLNQSFSLLLACNNIRQSCDKAHMVNVNKFLAFL